VAFFALHQVEVLHVPSRHDECAAGVAWPPLRSDTRVGEVGDRDNVAQLGVLVVGPLLHTAERAGTGSGGQ